MTFKLYDGIKDLTTVTGVGTATLVGTPPPGYRTLADVYSATDTFWYSIRHLTTGEWETGLGTYNGANVFSRTTVFESSNANSIVSFSPGPKTFTVTLPASRAELLSVGNAIDDSITNLKLANMPARTIKLNNTAATADPIDGTPLQLTEMIGTAQENLLINGDFQINQRAFAGGALAAGVYGYDRWDAATGGANISVSGYTVTLTSGAIEQPVETAFWGVASLASTPVTISVDTPSQDLTVTFGTQSGTITAGSGRRSVTLTLGAGDTGNRILRIQRATAGSVTFSRVKLEIGSVATAWVPRSAQQELLLAQRYYYRRIRIVAFETLFNVVFYNTTQCWGGGMKLPATMRTSPTVTISDISHFRVYVTVSRVISAISNFGASQDYAVITGGITITGGTEAVGASAIFFMSDAAAWVAFDAEL